MFDWLEFDKSVKKGFEDQAAQLNSYIEKIIEKNAYIRDLPIFEKPSEETVKRILYPVHGHPGEGQRPAGGGK